MRTSTFFFCILINTEEAGAVKLYLGENLRTGLFGVVEPLTAFNTRLVIKKRKSWESPTIPLFLLYHTLKKNQEIMLTLPSKHIQDSAAHHFQYYQPSLSHHYLSLGLLHYPSISLFVSTFASFIYSAEQKREGNPFKIKMKQYHPCLFETFQQLPNLLRVRAHVLTKSQTIFPHLPLN